MVVLLTIIHVLVCTLLILSVLLQTGKRADLAGAFGGGGSQTAFGARGAATFLSKATTIGAVVFMVTSLALAVLSSHENASGGASVLDDVPTPPAQSAPALTPPTPQAPPSGTAPAPTEEPGSATPTSTP